MTRCPAPLQSGSADGADAYLRLFSTWLREVVNQTRPHSQLLGLCARSAHDPVVRLVRSLGTQQLIAQVSTRSFALAGRSSVRDFVCRLECERGAVLVLAGRAHRSPAGWQLVTLHQLPAVARVCGRQGSTVGI